jgi:hypothetical protein
MPHSGVVDDFASAVSADRGRPIRLMSAELGPQEPSGLWIATERCDWIVVPDTVGSAQRTAIICHELSHILLDHVLLGGDADSDSLVRLVAPDVSPAVARRMLARFSYADDLEVAAEALGTLLVAKLAQRAELVRVTDDAVSDRLR